MHFIILVLVLSAGFSLFPRFTASVLALIALAAVTFVTALAMHS